jgi:hypothetical protein
MLGATIPTNARYLVRRPTARNREAMSRLPISAPTHPGGSGRFQRYCGHAGQEVPPLFGPFMNFQEVVIPMEGYLHLNVGGLDNGGPRLRWREPLQLGTSCYSPSGLRSRAPCGGPRAHHQDISIRLPSATASADPGNGILPFRACEDAMRCHVSCRFSAAMAENLNSFGGDEEYERRAIDCAIKINLRKRPFRRVRRSTILINIFMTTTNISAAHNTTTAYKEAFVQFQKDQNYDWSIAIGVGYCPPDDEVLKRLTTIVAILSKRYLVSRYHKLPTEARFIFGVAFEGERCCGSRHAHILVRIPPLMKKCTREELVDRFPLEFEQLWHTLSLSADSILKPSLPSIPKSEKTVPLEFCRAQVARTIYSVKKVQSAEENWSRFAIILQSQVTKFKNKNLSVVQNRDRQKRAALGWT